MKKAFVPSMVLLDGTIPVGQSGNWSSGEEGDFGTIYIDSDGVLWFKEGDVWTDGQGHEFTEKQDGWLPLED